MFTSLLPWKKTETAGPETLDSLIEQAQQRAADLEASIPALALAVADGEDGALAMLRQVRIDQREASETAAMLVTAREEHEAREAKKRLEAAKLRHKALVNAVQKDLAESVKAAERLSKCIVDADAAYQELTQLRGNARKRLEVLPGYDTAAAMLTFGAIRQAVAQEMYRLTARLNAGAQNAYGLPSPSVSTHSAAGNPGAIPPLVNALKTVNTWAILQAQDREPK